MTAVTLLNDPELLRVAPTTPPAGVHDLHSAG
jgi:hypothetical protein